MSIFQYANEFSAGIAIALMALVARGYTPYLMAAPSSPEYRFRSGIALAGVVIAARLSYWDVIIPTFLYLNGGYSPVSSFHGQFFNTVSNIGVSAMALLWLSALYLSLPAGDRKSYNWLTVPFYPRKFGFWRDR